MPQRFPSGQRFVRLCVCRCVCWAAQKGAAWWETPSLLHFLPAPLHPPVRSCQGSALTRTVLTMAEQISRINGERVTFKIYLRIIWSSRTLKFWDFVSNSVPTLSMYDHILQNFISFSFQTSSFWNQKTLSGNPLQKPLRAPGSNVQKHPLSGTQGWQQ